MFLRSKLGPQGRRAARPASRADRAILPVSSHSHRVRRPLHSIKRWTTSTCNVRLLPPKALAAGGHSGRQPATGQLGPHDRAYSQIVKSTHRCGAAARLARHVRPEALGSGEGSHLDLWIGWRVAGTHQYRKVSFDVLLAKLNGREDRK